MHELLMYLNQRGVVTLMVMAQAGLVGAMRDPADLSYLADNVLLLRYFEFQGEARKALSVLKKRTGAHEHSVREFGMSGGRVSVGEPLAQFRGVLTGTPTMSGVATRLTPTDDRA
jgi:circadian clock protein KaiC